MKAQRPALDDPASLDAIDTAHNAFYYFLDALRILTLEPDEQCRVMGDYNVGWEIQFDIDAGRYQLDKGLVDAAEAQAILGLVNAVQELPQEALTGGAGRAANIAAMRHSAGVPLRQRAKELREILRPATARNAAYLGLPDSAA